MRFRMFLTKEEMHLQGYSMPSAFVKIVVAAFHTTVVALFACAWIFTVLIGTWSFTMILLIATLLFSGLGIFKKLYEKNSYVDVFENRLSYRSWPKKEVQIYADEIKSIEIALYTGPIGGSLVASNGKYGIVIKDKDKTFVEMPFTRAAWDLLLKIAQPNCRINISHWIDNGSILSPR